MKMHSLAACVLAATAWLPLAASVTLAPVFTDNAVLQRGKSVTVWGKADPGETVSVAFKGQTKTTQAGADGKWAVALAPMQAAAEGAVLTVTDGKGKPTALKNVVVGDVWMCTGQSNMEWPVRTALNPEKDIAASANPLIRHLKIAKTPADSPQDSVETFGWQEASPETTGEFSAPGYFFAREIQKEIGVPIGLLNISYGGTMVEAWMSEQAVKSNAQYKGVQDKWQRTLDSFPARQAIYEKKLAEWQAKKAGGKSAGRAPLKPEGPGSRQQPSSLYNGMLHPAIPYAVAGILWYQAEANAARHTEYGDLIRGMIRQWRDDFKQGDIPFYYVELANNKRAGDLTGYQWAYMREAQRAALQEPDTAWATAIDIGESNNAHFKNKQALGHRLALTALGNYYGKNVEWMGPQFEGASFADGAATLKFTHADGLRLEGRGDAFQLAGTDGVYHPAQAKVAGETVIVTSKDVPAPTMARYCFATDPKGPILRNQAGLPASPLRTDTFPEPEPKK